MQDTKTSIVISAFVLDDVASQNKEDDLQIKEMPAPPVPLPQPEESNPSRPSSYPLMMIVLLVLN